MRAASCVTNPMRIFGSLHQGKTFHICTRKASGCLIKRAYDARLLLRQTSVVSISSAPLPTPIHPMHRVDIIDFVAASGGSGAAPAALGNRLAGGRGTAFHLAWEK